MTVGPDGIDREGEAKVSWDIECPGEERKSKVESHKFPKKLYKCAKCKSDKVAWWKFPEGWRLIPATLSKHDVRDRDWRTDGVSPVWCDPSTKHECAPPSGGDSPAPLPGEEGDLTNEYKELPIPDRPKEKAQEPSEGEGEGEGEMPEGDPLKPLVDLITKKVVGKVQPGISEARDLAVGAKADAETAVKIAGEAQAEGGKGPNVTVVEFIPAPEAPKRDLGVQHKEFPRLLFWIQMGEPVYLSGQPGGGKTEAARAAAMALERPFGLISLNPGTPESRLIGYMDAGGVYRPTLYRKIYEGGGVFCIDEMDNASAAMLTTINGHTNSHGAFPDGLVEKHKDFVLVATGNTSGRGGTVNHAERRALDAATLDRFTLLDWPYDEGLEEVMVKAVLSDDAKRAGWLGWLREVRKFCKTNHPRLVVSPRTAVKGAKAIAFDKKFKLKDVVEEVLFKGVDTATVKAIQAAIPLPDLK